MEAAWWKFDAAQSEGQWSEARKMAQEALQVATQELEAARRTNNAKAKMAALELVVKIDLFVGDSFAANLAANDEVAAVRKAGDRVSEAAALHLLAEVQASRGDAAGAVENLKAALSIAKETSEKGLIAKCSRTLALALLATGEKDDALPLAREAVALYEELMDQDGEANSRRALNMVFVEKGQLEQAPNRQEALKALKRLATAVSARDTAGWQSAMDELNTTCAYSQQDIDEVVNKALEKDRTAATVFLEDQGIVAKSAGGPQTQMKETGKQIHYLNFRLNGLGYGPRFRCANAYKKQNGEDVETLAALSCLQVAEEAEDWEAELQFHPGVLDSMLQSGNAYYI